MTGRWTLRTSEVLPALQAIADASIDAVLSDVPYGLGSSQPSIDELIAYLTGSGLDMKGDFMGHDWEVPSLAVWRELFRVLKPGAPILIFAGSRTFDLIALGMRAAGFEIKDSIFWVQGQGMPKPASTTDKYLDAHFGVEREVISHGNSDGYVRSPRALQPGHEDRVAVGRVTAPGSPEAKRYDGYGHALRPSHEPILVARKPLDGTIAQNILAHDVGALNVKGCRLSTTERFNRAHSSSGFSGMSGYEPGAGRQSDSASSGRWPPNVIFVHDVSCTRIGSRKVKAAPAWNDNRPTPAAFTGAATSSVRHAGDDGTETVEAWACVDGCPVRMLDEQSGSLSSHGGGGAWPGGGGFQNGGKNADYRPIAKGDSGGASRFFPCFAWGPEDAPLLYEPKVDKTEREFGCEHLPLRAAGETVDREEGTAGIESGAAGAGRTGGARNHHPCLKPIAVTTWLAKLELPPSRENGSRTILIPYCGSGSEVIGAIRAGWDHVIGIERNADYVAIAEARLARWAEVPEGMDPADVKPEKVDARQIGLFGGTR